jgi:acyl-CoA thioesterase
MKDLEEIRRFFSMDRFATECAGIIIEEAEPGYAKCSLEIEPRHCNALGNPMGGAIFTLADFAFAVATNLAGEKTVSQSAQITYLSSCKGKKLIAESRIIKSGRTVCFCQTDIFDELGNRIALVTSSGIVLSNV